MTVLGELCCVALPFCCVVVVALPFFQHLLPLLFIYKLTDQKVKLFRIPGFILYTCRLKGQGGVDKNEVRLIAGPVMDMLTKRCVFHHLNFPLKYHNINCYRSVVVPCVSPTYQVWVYLCIRLRCCVICIQDLSPANWAASGSLVGKSVAWRADGRGFESHPRQPIFLWKMTVSGVLCCVALSFCCLLLLLPCLSQHLFDWLFMRRDCYSLSPLKTIFTWSRFYLQYQGKEHMKGNWYIFQCN